MKKPLFACLLVCMLLIGAIPWFASLHSEANGQTNEAVAMQANDIILNGTDYNETIGQYEPDLGNITVTPRVITEYCDFALNNDLKSALPNFVISPIVIIEYADYATTLSQSPYLGPPPYSNDTTPPNIVVTREPSGPTVPENQSVLVSADITDSESGVENATLQYTVDNSTNWASAYVIPMSLNLTQQPQNSLALSFNATIPGQPSGTPVRFRIVAYDFAGNNATSDGVTDIFTYSVIPEFPSLIVLPLFMVATLLAIVAYRRKHTPR